MKKENVESDKPSREFKEICTLKEACKLRSDVEIQQYQFRKKLNSFQAVKSYEI